MYHIVTIEGLYGFEKFHMVGRTGRVMPKVWALFDADPWAIKVNIKHGVSEHVATMYPRYCVKRYKNCRPTVTKKFIK